MNPNTRDAEAVRGKPELVMVAKPDVELRARPDGLTSAANADLSPLSDVLDDEGATIEPLFGTTEERLRADVEAVASESDMDVPDLSLYYNVDADEDRMEAVAKRLNELDAVEAAYVKPPAEPAEAVGEAEVEALNDMTPAMESPPVNTPDFTPRQGYLDSAPDGIDARYAWQFPGGRGQGVDVIDLEWGWNFSHEDHQNNQGGVVGGSNSPYDNHGTAVIGEIGGDQNGLGVTGIASEANVSAVAFSMATARAIRLAANRLHRGDIMLLEIHRPGPRNNFQQRGDQDGYIAIEWWPDDWAAIRYAVAKGVIVVEAAGNGDENLDDAIYDNRPSWFPSDWSNPFRRGDRDSGAIVVGAGAPPSGTHGNDWGPDRSRLGFSNYGSILDAQGWGREVTTTGYGDLQGGSNKNEWYTDQFSGTSSASPIVVGALACAQGILRRDSQAQLSPLRARELLRSTGTPQQDAPGRPSSQRIGNRPDLRELIPNALQTSDWTGVQFRGTVPANSTRRWFTWGWPAQWHVLWTVVPTSPDPGGPQISWNVEVERATHENITYWISITNKTGSSVDVEARYAVLGET
ncbi:S8 family peptidase [Haloferax larsenii]|uniref:Serine protease, subtilisin family n=1 Tax=Haloferax larsenii TaxID=302484 RepID=A0A1H7QFL4_HALLR|nr:S8 family peptidase [Haloferax larsenii]SEL46713.1 Serine protease, subtilisin family [Haloferax larsenii]